MDLERVLIAWLSPNVLEMRWQEELESWLQFGDISISKDFRFLWIVLKVLCIKKLFTYI
jgi:hypothetical protein